MRDWINEWLVICSSDVQSHKISFFLWSRKSRFVIRDSNDYNENQRVPQMAIAWPQYAPIQATHELYSEQDDIFVLFGHQYN